MADEHPIIERLADHSDMLATLTDIIAKLTLRVEALEQLEPFNVARKLGNRFDTARAVAQARRDLEVPDD